MVACIIISWQDAPQIKVNELHSCIPSQLHHVKKGPHNRIWILPTTVQYSTGGRVGTTLEQRRVPYGTLVLTRAPSVRLWRTYM